MPAISLILLFIDTSVMIFLPATLYTRSMDKSKLIIMSGLPGSGKSTVAESLSAKLSVPLFSVDPIEASLLKSGLKRSFETGLAAYLVAETLAVNAVQEARDLWHNLVRTHHAVLIIIECVVERAIHKRRLESRIRNLHGIAEVTWEEVENRRKEYLPWKEERLVLDTATAHEQNVKKALDYIHHREQSRS